MTVLRFKAIQECHRQVPRLIHESNTCQIRETSAVNLRRYSNIHRLNDGSAPPINHRQGSLHFDLFLSPLHGHTAVTHVMSSVSAAESLRLAMSVQKMRMGLSNPGRS